MKSDQVDFKDILEWNLCRVLELKVQDLGCRVSLVGLGVQDFGFGIEGSSTSGKKG